MADPKKLSERELDNRLRTLEAFYLGSRQEDAGEDALSDIKNHIAALQSEADKWHAYAEAIKEDYQREKGRADALDKGVDDLNRIIDESFGREKALAAQVERVREPVRWFAERMEERLKAHDHRPGWKDSTFGYLQRRLRQEQAELDAALDKKWNAEEIIRECADVANFCMMIADNFRPAALDGPEDTK